MFIIIFKLGKISQNIKISCLILPGSLASLLKKFINADIPYVPWLTGYIAIIIGAIMTFLVQSSSVFTSTLTPLVGVGLITVSKHKYLMSVLNSWESQNFVALMFLR